MTENMTSSQQLLDQVVGLMEDYRTMIGPEDPAKQAQYGFVPGLNMIEDERMLSKKIDEMKQGLFQVLFIGPFNAGKSTLINALLGQEILRSNINPETAVLSKIVFRDDEGIKVFKKGNPQPEEYTVGQFFEKFRVEQDNESKFADIDYVVISQQSATLDRTIQLVDSPGLQNTVTEDRIAKEFARRADAIVFLTNGTQAWNFDEVVYLDENFGKKENNNLFFVITYADQIKEEELPGLKTRTRQVLKDIFIDSDGNFDEKKYNNRVFFLNGAGALCARAGKPYRIGRMVVPIQEKDTGIIEFQTELYRFLSSDDKHKIALQSFTSQLEGRLTAAKAKNGKILEGYMADRSTIEAERDKYSRSIKDLETILGNINNACLVTAKNIALTASMEYDAFVTRIEAEWGDYFNETKVDFGMKEALKLSGINLNIKRRTDVEKEQAIREVAEPITTAISEYIEKQSMTFEKVFTENVVKQINDLSELITKYVEQIDELSITTDDILAELIQELCRDHPNIDPNILTSGNVNLGQVLVALLLTQDPEGVMEGLMGNVTWSDFLKRTIITTVAEFIGGFIIGALFGSVVWIYLIFRAVVAAIHINREGKSMARKCIDAVQIELLDTLRTKKVAYLNEIEDEFGTGLIERTADATGFITRKVQEGKNDLDAILRNLSDQNFHIEDEQKRFSAITEKMEDTIENYRALVQ